MDTADLADPKHSASIPRVVLLHHILVRSPLSLPHKLHGWQEAEYVRWINEHDEPERLQLVEGVLRDYKQTQIATDGKADEEEQYLGLLRQLLSSFGSVA